MALGYHGTSFENAQGILKYGYKDDAIKLWSVSNGNMHVFDEKNYHHAITQSLNATIICQLLKRAVVVVDIKNKRLKKDDKCGDVLAYEILDKVEPSDIVGIYADEKPINSIFRVLQKVSICKMNKHALFNVDLIKLSEVEQELFDIIEDVKVKPNYNSLLKLIYIKSGYDLVDKFVAGF